MNADRYRNVGHIVTQLLPSGPKGLVVSAMKGVTDDLLRAVAAAVKQQDYQSILAQILSRHEAEIVQLLAPPSRDPLLEIVRNNSKELEEILRGVWLVKNASERIAELVSGMGEVWSAQILPPICANRVSTPSGWMRVRCWWCNITWDGSASIGPGRGKSSRSGREHGQGIGGDHRLCRAHV